MEQNEGAISTSFILFTSGVGFEVSLKKDTPINPGGSWVRILIGGCPFLREH